MLDFKDIMKEKNNCLYLTLEEYREIIKRTTMREDFNMSTEQIEGSQDFELYVYLIPERAKLKVKAYYLNKKKTYNVPLTQDEWSTL